MLVINCPASVACFSAIPGAANVKMITTFLAESMSTFHSIVAPSTSPVPPVLKCGIPLCVSVDPLSVVLTFFIVLANSLSRSFTAASNVFSSGTQNTICRLSSAVETVMTSPSGFAFQPLGISNCTPASLWLKTRFSCGAVRFAAGFAETTPPGIEPTSAKHKLIISFFKVLSSELGAFHRAPQAARRNDDGEFLRSISLRR